MIKLKITLNICFGLILDFHSIDDFPSTVDCLCEICDHDAQRAHWSCHTTHNYAQENRVFCHDVMQWNEFPHVLSLIFFSSCFCDNMIQNLEDVVSEKWAQKCQNPLVVLGYFDKSRCKDSISQYNYKDYSQDRNEMPPYPFLKIRSISSTLR